MDSTESKTCSICHQKRPARYFPKEAGGMQLPEKINICLLCRQADDEGDEGGGGVGLKLKKDAKKLQYDMELDAALQKKLKDLNKTALNKNIFGMSLALENESKKQAMQREMLDLKEEALKSKGNDDEPNLDLAANTKVKREKITRLFSVTRLLARNYLAANSAKAAMQKNLGIFSHTKEHQIAQKAQQLKKANTSKVLSAESSTLFSQQHPNQGKEPIADEAERLTTAIREAQKIFKG